MLIVKAPTRISLGGGGTDLPDYYSRYGGMVVSTSIDKYSYMFVAANDRSDVQIISSNYKNFLQKFTDEAFSRRDDLALPRAILHHLGLYQGLDIFLASQIPPGTGLGSSSSLAVAMIKGFGALTGGALSTADIAELACYVEIEKMGMPIGKQDQYAAAFGGLNAITFTAKGVTVEPIEIDPHVKGQLERNLMLFFTGISRKSSSILKEQRAAIGNNPTVVRALDDLGKIAQDMREVLVSGDLDQLGNLLDAGWHYKKKLANAISNPFIEKSYRTARQLGAVGGKIAGAGGGGFLLLYAEQDYQPAITLALQELGLKRMDFAFDDDGVSIVLNELNCPRRTIKRDSGTT